jgi:hypothetical protein
VPQKADEQTIEISADWRVSVDGTCSPLRIEVMRSIHPHLRFAMQAFGGKEGEKQRSFNLRHLDLSGEHIPINFS